MAIPNAVPDVTIEDIESVASVMKDGWISNAGPAVVEFEQQLAQAFSHRKAIATVSGTSALIAAMRILGRPGDQVIMPAMSFVATANAAKINALFPVFIDIDPMTGQMSVEGVRRYIDEQCVSRRGALLDRASGRRVSGLVTVDLYGVRINSHAFIDLAREFGLWLVEDRAQSIGVAETRDNDVPLAKGHVVTSSFNTNKIITTGGGGVVCTSDLGLFDELFALCTTSRPDSRRFYHTSEGMNLRMTNVAAAFGISQLKRLPQYVRKRKAIADEYYERLKGSGIELYDHRALAEQSNCWMPIAFLTSAAAECLAQNVTEVVWRPLWVPMPNLPHFQEYAHRSNWPNSQSWHERAVCLPSFQNMSSDQIAEVCSHLKEALT